jgi:polysaccharide deacetylase 2 family uncharacterized protein YibQ
MTELKREGSPRRAHGPASVAADRAAREGVLCFRIDTVLEAPGRYDAEVKGLNRLLDDSIDLARRRGYAIVVAHPDGPSLDVLKRAIPKLKRSGVRFESLKTLLEPRAVRQRGWGVRLDRAPGRWYSRRNPTPRPGGKR